MADNNTNGQNGNGFHRLHDYMATLLAPTSKGTASRRAWGIEVENVWVPYFTATNVNGLTSVPTDVLGKPLRLARSKDGAIRFSDSGRPVMRVAPELNDSISLARANFVASLQAYTGMTVTERPEDYRAVVEAAQNAAMPIAEKEFDDLAEAARIFLENSHKDEAVPESAPSPKSKAKVA